MKRVQLIEYGIVTIGLIFAYKAFDSFFGILIQFMVLFEGSGFSNPEVILPTLVILVVYSVCFILLIRKSRQIAIYISGLSPGEDVPVKMGKKALLQIVLIGICVATMLTSLAKIILYLIETFVNEAGRIRYSIDDRNMDGKNEFYSACIRTIIAGVVIYFSRDISSWFSRKNEVDELTFESNPED